MTRVLLWAATLTLGLAPALVAVGAGLLGGVGMGLIAGGAAYGVTAAWALSADLLPEEREVSR